MQCLCNPDKGDLMKHNLDIDLEIGIVQWSIAVVGRENPGVSFLGLLVIMITI